MNYNSYTLKVTLLKQTFIITVNLLKVKSFYKTLETPKKEFFKNDIYESIGWERK